MLPLSTTISSDEQYLEQVFREFEDYKFTEDPTFNAGLPTVFEAIKGKKMTPGLIDKTIAEAQWFYWTKINNLSIPFSVYTAHVERQRTSPSTSNQEGNPSDPLSRMRNLSEAMRMMEVEGKGETNLTFDKLCELIREGRADELKGNDIPDELNTATPSQSTLSARPKPWQSNSAFDQTSQGIAVDPIQQATGSSPFQPWSSPLQSLPGALSSTSPDDLFSYPAIPDTFQGINPSSSENLSNAFPNVPTIQHPYSAYGSFIPTPNENLSSLMQNSVSPGDGGFEYINWSAGDESSQPTPRPRSVVNPIIEDKQEIQRPYIPSDQP
ncbi:uncharacterized protein IL334_007635 [Kwoniella shivajii]|uniref:Uncharacterized protein n=1 Tax=Kwoniella shivajii TaxID=564305 RepID=A0ABZ1DAM1_9TREE|nr:hypothetical protein IL334_007635 [Kwoniella shivajii]